MSSASSSLAAPSSVLIVRSPSGDTTISERPVGRPDVAATPGNSTPRARRSWPNTAPSWSPCPRAHRLRRAPAPGAARFRGVGDVAGEIVEPVAEIVLNALDLEIDEVWLVATDGRRVDAQPSLDAASERLTLTLDAEAAPGQWT